jgi:hypothetical protein
MDGFNLPPRLSVPFSGPINPSTVNSNTLFLVCLGSAVLDQDYMPQGNGKKKKVKKWTPTIFEVKKWEKVDTHYL